MLLSTYEKIEQLGLQYNTGGQGLLPGRSCSREKGVLKALVLSPPQGIDKAVFNLFKIYGSLGDTKLAFSSDGAETMEQVEKQFMKREAR